jgi:hypothetical protein
MPKPPARKDESIPKPPANEASPAEIQAGEIKFIEQCSRRHSLGPNITRSWPRGRLALLRFPPWLPVAATTISP